MTERRARRGWLFYQFLLGIGANLLIALPFLRRAHGVHRLEAGRRHLFVCNHVSLLDTILLGAILWRARCLPMLVLGDRKVWHASWIRRLLSSRIGYLIDRGRHESNRTAELETFARAGRDFQLVVFPEGTRGDGVNVQECRPGIHSIVQAAQLVVVPVFFENMQLVSTKHGGFHPLRGFRKVEVHFGEPISPEQYQDLSRDEFLEFIRRRIAGALRSGGRSEASSRLAHRCNEHHV